MSTDRQAPATDTKAEGVASEAALFVTFYNHREKQPEKVSPLCERLEALIQQNPTNKLSPRSYDPPAAQDATIIRFAINAPKEEDAATAWETMRRELQDILNDEDLPKDWWGYTLVYQAVLKPDVGLASVPDELLTTVRRLDSSDSLESLEQADIAGGRVWLMGIPRGDGLAAATMYVALSPSDEETAFKRALFGPELSMLDLIAHKGYRLRREYRGDLEHDYEKGLDAFRESTYDLLSDLGQQIEETDRLDDLARKHEVLVKFVSELKRLRISVAQQLPNYRKWQEQTGSDGIAEYHYGHLDMAHQELELMVAQGQDALETANTAMSMAQVQIDKALVQAEKEHEGAQRERDKALVRAEKEHERAQREIDKAQDRRQLRIEAWLAAAALALALPHLLEPETTAALLALWPIGIEGLHDSETGLLTESGHLTVLFAQSLIILTFVVAAYLVVKRSLRKPRGFH